MGQEPRGRGVSGGWWRGRRVGVRREEEGGGVRKWAYRRTRGEWLCTWLGFGAVVWGGWAGWCFSGEEYVVFVFFETGFGYGWRGWRRML
jgi:hypothetical protein